MKKHTLWYLLVLTLLSNGGLLVASDQIDDIEAAAPRQPVRTKLTEIVDVADADEEDEAEEQVDIEMQDHVADEQQETEEVEDVRGVPIVSAEQFDEETKKKQTIKLVEHGAAYLLNNPEDKALNAINHDKRFVSGELYIFVLDITEKQKAICLAHGQEHSFLWQDVYNHKDRFGVNFVQNYIQAALKSPSGTWTTYQWRGATKISWVKIVKKGEKTYLIGSGYYPHSKGDAVVNMVKSAVALFNRLIEQGHPIDEAFSNFSYPIGRFVYGDLYLYALDFKGMHFAHGELPGLIGTNGWLYRDASGKLVNQEIVAKLKDKDFGVGIWTEYLSKNAPKRTYAEKVADKEGNIYFIACGYYPTADRKHAVDLVRKGYQYMKQNGVTQAAKSFSEKRNMQFRYGDLTLAVYDMKGVCIANGRDPEFVGENQLNVQDEDGNYYIKEMVQRAEKERQGWIDAKLRNSFQSLYFELIDVGIETFVISCGVFPTTKFETMTLMAKSGADYLKDHDVATSMQEFLKKNGGRFLRGDLELFVFDSAGICYVYGDEYDLIWRNLLNINDDDGKPFIKIFINTVKRGPGTVTYKLNGALKTAYLEPVKKGSKMFVIGSSFYH